MNYEVDRSSFRNRYPEIANPEIRRQMGQELRSTREFQNLTIEQVRAATKINTHYLENLEQGNWSFLPPTYVKLFIKAYAEAVGLMSEELTGRLDELFKSALTIPQFPKVHPVQSGGLAEVGAENPPGILVWAERNRSMLFYGLLTLVIIILIIVYLARPTQPPISLDEKGEQIEESAIPEPREDTTLFVGVSEPQVEPEPPLRETLDLKIIANDTCYLKIEHADSLIYERTLWPGNRLERELPAPIKLSLGNAPGVRIIVDGDTMSLPSRRRVRALRLGSGGVTE